MSDRHDSTGGNDDAQARGESIEKTAKWKRRAQRTRAARAHRVQLPDLLGCPFSDAVLSGLYLDPRLDCGPAHLEGARLIWDPMQPVWKQLQELAEQTAKWRDRRGLRLVHSQPEQRGQTTTVKPVLHCRPELRVIEGGPHHD